MKASELRIGEKYVPVQKTAGFFNLDRSPEWDAAQRIGQGFLYYRGYHDSEYVFSSKMDGEKEFVSGDFFNPEDVVPFDDEQKFLRDLYSVSGPLAKEMLKKRHPNLFDVPEYYKFYQDPTGITIGHEVASVVTAMAQDPELVGRQLVIKSGYTAKLLKRDGQQFLTIKKLKQ